MPSLLLVVLSALLISLSRLPLHLGFLVFLGWLPLLHYLNAPKVRLWAAAAIFTSIYIALLFNWITAVTPGGLVGIGVIFFFYYWFSFYLIRLIGKAYPRLYELGFISVMLSFEYLQNFSEMRFPWFHNAYSLADYTILIQAADLGGVIMLSALILLINVLVSHAFRGQKRAIEIAGIVLLVWLGYGWLCLHHMPLPKHKADIAVMQPSIPQADKWDKAFYETLLSRYDQLCAKAAADSIRLLIFPEAAMPLYLMHSPASLRQLQWLAQRYNLDIFSGFPHYETAPPEHVDNLYYYNAAALFKPDGYISPMYYKNILVPVGERMLWLEHFPFLWKLQFGQANWEFGKELGYFACSDYQFSSSICYEIAFAGIHQRMAIPLRNGKPDKMDFLVNITNDAWFGTSYGPWLHAVMTKFRAVENRIQIYRSANTGISMIVDPCGRVLSHTKLFDIANLKAPLYTSSRIPLYRYLAWYPLLFVGLSIGLGILSIWKNRKGKA